MSSIPASDTLLSCASCGATVYPEHLDRCLAGYWAGALYCPCCLTEKKNGKPAPAKPAEAASLALEEAPVHESPPAPPDAGPASAPAAIHHYKYRPPRPDAKGASRVRIFHARLSDGAVAHLDDQINDWLDRHPEVEIKLANTTVGIWEGKHAEPNLILTVFY